MIDAMDIYRAAKLMAEQYGADAATHAAIRADQMLRPTGIACRLIAP